MAFERGIDGSEPIRAQPAAGRAGLREVRHSSETWRLGGGTLACPLCDAPVSLGGAIVAPADDLDCPFCRHTGAVRDFLSLAAPQRPARVEIRLRQRSRRASGRGSATPAHPR
jgi:hypothetical protein